MVSVQSLYTAVLAFSALLPQASAHRRSTNTNGVPVIDARLVDPSGRALDSREIADLAGRTVELTVKDHGPSITKRDELDERNLLLVAIYIAAASGEDDAEAYADDLESGE